MLKFIILGLQALTGAILLIILVNEGNYLTPTPSHAQLLWHVLLVCIVIWFVFCVSDGTNRCNFGYFRGYLHNSSI